ncbi:hypothetical protein B7G68_10045 [Caulobacter segnis]|uniref:Uncharacterized protein n=1 Tax=Caulobacter segnis TaxID=88688 RepID=A0ABN5ITV6_9CAUL|nr:hypothetical protein B7G68_10045 [Caulobacter segnis]
MPLKGWKGTRSAGHPSGGLKCVYRFDEARRSAWPLSGEPSTRGVLTRLRKRPPTGGPGRRPRSRNARAISARTCRVAEVSAARASSRYFREPAPGSAAKTPSRKKTGERFPLDHPRQPSRSPAGRPFQAIG